MVTNTVICKLIYRDKICVMKKKIILRLSITVFLIVLILFVALSVFIISEGQKYTYVSEYPPSKHQLLLGYLTKPYLISILFENKFEINPINRMRCRFSGGNWIEIEDNDECKSINPENCYKNENCMISIKHIPYKSAGEYFCRNLSTCKCPGDQNNAYRLGSCK